MLIDFGGMNTFAEHFTLLVSTWSCFCCINDTAAGGNYCNRKNTLCRSVLSGTDDRRTLPGTYT